MPDNTIDGTPDAVKAACPVWSGGKSGDNFKGLPITIRRAQLVEGPRFVCQQQLSAGEAEHR